MKARGQSVTRKGAGRTVRTESGELQIGDSLVDRRLLAALCHKWAIRRLSLFGSALRNQQHAQSDVDLLVDFNEGEAWSLLDLVHAQEEFAALIGRPVDLVDRASLQRSANWVRRDAILASAEIVYAA